MRITFITSSLSGGGAERVVSILANELIKRNNIEISIIALIEDKVTYPLDHRIDYYANNLYQEKLASKRKQILCIFKVNTRK